MICFSNYEMIDFARALHSICRLHISLANFIVILLVLLKKICICDHFIKSVSIYISVWLLIVTFMYVYFRIYIREKKDRHVKIHNF